MYWKLFITKWKEVNGLIVDYIGIFDDVAKALDFDEKSIEKVITNIEEVKHKFPGLIHKCLEYFIGVDRTVEGWEGLMAAQQCLPTNKEKDAFGADYRVVNRAYNALSPDPFLDSFRFDYKWLSKVYESIKPVDTRGPLIWASVGAKTLELVHENIDVMGVHEAAEEDILELDADLIEDFIEGKEGAKKKAKKVEIDLVARILEHSDDSRFIKLGERLEELREKHEQGLITSIEFLKHLLELAHDAAQAEREVVPVAETVPSGYRTFPPCSNRTSTAMSLLIPTQRKIPASPRRMSTRRSHSCLTSRAARSARSFLCRSSISAR